MLTALLSRIIILSLGTLYPAYSSYKAIRTKNVKEYVKWMMYWIVFAFFTCIETFTDIFCAWLPFYYEVKVILVLWLLSPHTRGSSTLYRKFVHPKLIRHEEEIDQYLVQAKERGYSVVFQLGTKGVHYATNVIVQTAIKGGGNLVQNFKKSYSLTDISETDSVQHTIEETTKVISTQPNQRILRPRAQAALTRSASTSRHSTGMYFSEVNVTNKKQIEQIGNVRSAEDLRGSCANTGETTSLGSTQSNTATLPTTTRTRIRSRRGELDMFGYGDDDDHDDDYNGVGGHVTTTKVLGLTDLVSSPHNFASNTTYTIDAGKILNLMRLLESQADNLSLVSENSEINNLADVDEPFVDCSSNQVEDQHVLRPSTKKRRAPQPPTPQTTPTTDTHTPEDSLNECDDFTSAKNDINPYGISGDYLDVGTYRERSKSASSTSSTRSILKGFSFFRMKNAAK